MKKAASIFSKAFVARATAKEEMHRADERRYWEKQINVGRKLNLLTGAAAGVAMSGIIVLGVQTCTLTGQVADSHAQISAFLAIPETPETIIKLDNDWHMILDFYLANVGESAARETYLSTVLTLSRGANDFAPIIFKIAGGPMLITTKEPWHHVFDLGLPLNMTMYNGLPKPGEPPNVTQMILMPTRFGATLKGDATFTTVFGKVLNQPINLVAGFADSRIACCNFLQLQKGIPMIYVADLSRISTDDETKPKQ
jgi:hypothetical protein